MIKVKPHWWRWWLGVAGALVADGALAFMRDRMANVIEPSERIYTQEFTGTLWDIKEMEQRPEAVQGD